MIHKIFYWDNQQKAIENYLQLHELKEGDYFIPIKIVEDIE